MPRTLQESEEGENDSYKFGISAMQGWRTDMVGCFLQQRFSARQRPGGWSLIPHQEANPSFLLTHRAGGCTCRRVAAGGGKDWQQVGAVCRAGWARRGGGGPLCGKPPGALHAA